MMAMHFISCRGSSFLAKGSEHVYAIQLTKVVLTVRSFIRMNQAPSVCLASTTTSRVDRGHCAMGSLLA